MALDSKSSFSMGCSKNLLHAMHERINVTVFFCDSVTCKRIKAGPCLSYCKQKSTISSHTPISPFPPLFPFVNKTVKDFDWTMHGWAILGRIASSSILFLKTDGTFITLEDHYKVKPEWTPGLHLDTSNQPSG